MTLLHQSKQIGICDGCGEEGELTAFDMPGLVGICMCDDCNTEPVYQSKRGMPWWWPRCSECGRWVAWKDWHIDPDEYRVWCPEHRPEAQASA